MRRALSIAGSDCSGGAGIQADLKTMAAHGVYGMSVITALTAQNTQGVSAVTLVTPEMVSKQMAAVFSDIRPDAVKLGMLGNREIAQVVAEGLKAFDAPHLVVDPVLTSTSGAELFSCDALEIYLKHILPLAQLITPNLSEASALIGGEIKTKADMAEAAAQLHQTLGCSVLIKGGHLAGSPDDLLYHEGRAHWYAGHRITNPNTHGTGCTLSSAIACGLAKEKPLEEAVASAKSYIERAIACQLNLGKGRGPLNHMV